MSLFDIQRVKDVFASEWKKYSVVKVANACMSVCALAVLSGGVSSVSAASLSRSVDVSGTPAAVWSMIGPFCAIRDWLPPIGACTEDNKTPPTRTLVTKDGQATFVELQTARNDLKHTYSYSFISSPLPVTQYTSTIEVVAKGAGSSTVTWSASYTPDAGKENDASDALNGVYEAGLNAIKTQLAK